MKNFKKEIVSLVAMLRVGQYLNRVEDELRNISDLRDYSNKEYNGDKGGYKKNIDTYCTNASSMCNSIGKEVYQSAEKTFCEMVDNPLEVQKYFKIKGKINEPKDVFEEILKKTKERLKKADSVDSDDFCLWLAAADEVLYGTEPPKEALTQCSSCGGLLEKVPAEEVGLQKGYVYKCPDCDSYAICDEQGLIVGISADKETHEVREKSYTAIKKLCEEKGLTLQETLRYVSRATKISIKKLSDIEYLYSNECQQIVGYVLQKTIFDTSEKPKYPKNYKDMMKFLENGWRLRFSKSLKPDRNGRLLIPIMVCENAIMVKGKEGNERVLMPANLKYEFRGDTVTIKLPTNSEVLKLYPQYEG